LFGGMSGHRRRPQNDVPISSLTIRVGAKIVWPEALLAVPLAAAIAARFDRRFLLSPQSLCTHAISYGGLEIAELATAVGCCVRAGQVLPCPLPVNDG
jgi:hypothetical protein